MLPFGLHYDITEKPDGRSEIEGVFRKVSEKSQPPFEGVEKMCPQVVNQIKFPPDSPEIKENAGMKKIFWRS